MDDFADSPVRRGKTPVPIRGYVRGRGRDCERIHTHRFERREEPLGCMTEEEQANLSVHRDMYNKQRIAKRDERNTTRRAKRANRSS